VRQCFRGLGATRQHISEPLSTTTCSAAAILAPMINVAASQHARCLVGGWQPPVGRELNLPVNEADRTITGHPEGALFPLGGPPVRARPRKKSR
jgi:hypothetical protein